MPATFRCPHVLRWNRQSEQASSEGAAMSTTPSNVPTNQSKWCGLKDSTKTSQPPCQYCMDLKRENIVGRDYISKSIAFNASRVMTAKSIKCPYCKLIINALQAFDISPLSPIPWELGATSGLVLNGNSNGTKHKLEFYVTPEEERLPMIPSSIASSKHVRPIWDDPREIQTLKGWLVKDTPQLAKLPTRILDLGIGMDDLANIRILERPVEAEKALYAALSHCWLREDIETTKTISHNIQTRLTSLSLSDIPETFSQAISVCRQIGVQYLWIDSLCIIQDDSVDWQREGADMNNIYANAWFTIAMHHSTRGYIPFKDVQLAVGRQSAAVHVRCIPELLDIVESRAVAPAVGNVYEVAGNEHWSSVTQRGWCYQERALSHRMVHFTEHEYLYEERGSVRRCQCKQHFGFGLGFAGSLSRWSTQEDVTHQACRTLVQQYTQRMFGCRSDLLPGFAGVAKRFSERRDLGRYIAGLWEKDLIKWLCWRSREWVSSRASTWACENCRPHPQRIPWTRDQPIPSFSWASRFGPCEFVYESWKLNESVEVASIERIECLMDEEGPFFNVRRLDSKNCPEDPYGWYLRIRGSLYPCMHFSTSGRGFAFNVSMSLCSKEYAWAVPDSAVGKWDLSRNAKDILIDAQKHGNEYCIDAGDDLPPDNSRIYLLPLFEYSDGGGRICLILRPCSEKINAVEVSNTVEERESPHWMERIGISVFNNSRFDTMKEQPNQVIHLM